MKVDSKRRTVVFTALAIVFCLCGCVAPKALDGSKVKIDSMNFYESGILEFSGHYDDGSWGVSTLRGKIDGNAIVLDGMAEFWGGEEDFFHRIAVPSRIKEVRFGKNVIWKREEKKIVAKKESTVPESKKKAPGKEPDKLISQLTSDPAADEEFPDIEPDALEENDIALASEETFSRMKIGGDGAFLIDVKFMDFENIFWGVEIPEAQQNGKEVKHLANMDVQEINRYKNLEVLEIKGVPFSRIDLTGLALPKLKKLVIDDGEVAGLSTVELPELEEFYLNDTRTVPLGKIALPEKMPKLHTVGIQAFAGNFDFDSLSGKPISKLKIHGDCFRFGFLKGLPLKELKFSGFSVVSENLDVLRSLPLTHLKLVPLRPIADWSFLQGMKLQLLDIKCSAGSNFSPALLQGMPLERLRIMVSSPVDWDAAWEKCSKLPLKEIILCGGKVPEKFLIDSKLESVALFNCAWHTIDPFAMLNRMKSMKHLAAWRIVQWQNNRPAQMLDAKLDWKKFNNKQIESLCISTYDINFLQQLPGVTKVAVRECGNNTLKMSQLHSRTFEALMLPRSVDSRHPTVKSGARVDRIGADW